MRIRLDLRHLPNQEWKPDNDNQPCDCCARSKRDLDSAHAALHGARRAHEAELIVHVREEEKEGNLQHPWQPARLNGWKSVCLSSARHSIQAPNDVFAKQELALLHMSLAMTPEHSETSVENSARRLDKEREKFKSSIQPAVAYEDMSEFESSAKPRMAVRQ